MDRLLHQLILRYQHTPHHELGGMTPHQKWSEGIHASGLPIIPAFTPEMDRLFLRMHPHTRQARSRGIPAFGLNYWSAELGGIERRERDGRAIQYHFRYDPADIRRIALFRDGIWVGDGYAKELQLADGTYLQISLSEWRMAKHQVASGENGTGGKTPAELALVSGLQELGKQRTKEKKAAQRQASKRAPKALDEPNQVPESPSIASLDDETERVLRFLHG